MTNAPHKTMERHECETCAHCMTDTFADDWCVLQQRSCSEERAEGDCGRRGILWETIRTPTHEGSADMNTTPDTDTEDDKPPALAAMAILQIMDEMVDKEVLISQKIALRAFLAKVREDESVKIILDVEQEVGQEVFAYGIRMFKTMLGSKVSEMKAMTNADQGSTEWLDRDDVVDAIDSIKLTNPYAAQQGEPT